MASSATATTRTERAAPVDRPARKLMKTALLVDGRLVETGLPLSDRGFRYGMAVFETIAVRDAGPILLDPHLEKLAEAVALAKFVPPAGWLESIHHALAAPPITEGVTRVYVTAGDRDGDASRVALIHESLVVPATLSAQRAVTADFVAPTPFGKTANYWPHFLARPPGGNDAILCAPGGRLLSAAMGNLFLVRDGALVTPREPVRRGVIRDWLLANFPAAEADLTRADLPAASAAFATNSRVGVAELTAIDGRELPGDPLVAEIFRRYRSEVLGVR